jgi:CubicO group peptidase (beta-lactamase class C family)
MIVRQIALILLLFAAPAICAESFVFQAAKPETQGLSSAKLDELRAGLEKHATRALLVMRHDRLVYEWYADGNDAEKKQGTASMAKEVVGGLSLAVAMHDGCIKPDDLASKYIPQWHDDPQKSKITIAELAMHTSGLSDAEEGEIPHDKLTGWKGEFWLRKPRDPFTISRDITPILFAPGDHVSYSNPGMAMLSYAVTASIQSGKQKDIRSLLWERIYQPIGIGEKEWSVGYGETPRVDGLNLVANWGGAAFTPRAAIRIGRLLLREGDWDGHRILDAADVRAFTNPPEAPASGDRKRAGGPSPGFGCWTNRQNVWKSVPRDTYIGAGANHQLLIVIPSWDMVVIRNGATLTNNDKDWWSSVERELLAPLAAAVVDQPYPASQVIRSIHFDDATTIVRKAPDSDNWPITWGDDDQLYTAYGDGRGFEPFVKPKLSLGFVRVEGGPTDFHGFNIRSESGERTGGGAKGAKASGMLMVDGTLYMWVRNVKNSQIAWSTDHGVTWNPGFKFDASFGCPAFLNFGRNYAGARDDYVYTYSQNGPGAYEPYDGVVLARVPKSKIRERAAYEFFAGTDSSGGATWTSDVTNRTHAFEYPGHCDRIDVVFNPAIHRYLMALAFGDGKGGWGIFDAPEPWGPWTTAYITHDWGLGDTHGYRLPSKWISADGKEVYLVYSGIDSKRVINDAFCVRRFTLELSSPCESQ